jgi:hypothetical protein
MLTLSSIFDFNLPVKLKSEISVLLLERPLHAQDATIPPKVRAASAAFVSGVEETRLKVACTSRRWPSRSASKSFPGAIYFLACFSTGLTAFILAKWRTPASTTALAADM